nr:DUF4194 domain-containing protein [Moorella sulfitireducens]
MPVFGPGENISEQDRERLRDVINRLLAVNFLNKEQEREHYLVARRHRQALEDFFRFLGWEIVFDDRHECIFVLAPEAGCRRNLTREESIWLLVLRLIYQEKRQGLSLSEFPVTTLHEIRAKYEAFRLPLFNKTRLQELVRLGTQYRLLEPLDDDLSSDDCAFRLFHTLLYAVRADTVEKLHQKIANYEQGREVAPDEVVAPPAAD